MSVSSAATSDSTANPIGTNGNVSSSNKQAMLLKQCPPSYATANLQALCPHCLCCESLCQMLCDTLQFLTCMPCNRRAFRATALRAVQSGRYHRSSLFVYRTLGPITTKRIYVTCLCCLTFAASSSPSFLQSHNAASLVAPDVVQVRTGPVGHVSLCNVVPANFIVCCFNTNRV
jgi:hypothetical protein